MQLCAVNLSWFLSRSDSEGLGEHGMGRIIRAAMKHAYWVVICKTPNCGAIPAKYIGPDDGHWAYELPHVGVPDSWFASCSGCGKNHRYFRDDLQVQSSESAPPSGFQSLW